MRWGKLFSWMDERGMTSGQLHQWADFGANTIVRLKRMDCISFESIGGICPALECGVDGILDFVHDDHSGDIEDKQWRTA